LTDFQTFFGYFHVFQVVEWLHSKLRLLKKNPKIWIFGHFSNFSNNLWSKNHVLKKIGRGSSHDLFSNWYFLTLSMMWGRRGRGGRVIAFPFSLLEKDLFRITFQPICSLRSIFHALGISGKYHAFWLVCKNKFIHKQVCSLKMPAAVIIFLFSLIYLAFSILPSLLYH
jgi:hypothetical protein